MKYSYKWLKKLVNIDTTPEKLAKDLSLKSVEIDSIEKYGGDFLDTVFEGKPAANRGDLLNHVGLAREISAIYGGISNFQFPISNLGAPSAQTINNESESVRVEIENLETCPLYTARLIRGVKIGHSPIWMQQALLACGMKPINNIVDITNYVMLEYGNPLHAFDTKKLKIKNKKEKTNIKNEKIKIIIRLSKEDEVIKTLDGKDHELPEGLLVITNEDAPIAVAGVMGGENSEIDETTTDIILESATFSRAAIRKSQQELGITTEASLRFTKGLSKWLALKCLERATQLLEEVCGGKAVETPIIAGELPLPKEAIEVNFDKIRDFLSIDIKDIGILKILGYLGFSVENNKVTPPNFREDINIWQDVAEEIGRIYGLDKVSEKDLNLEIEPDTDKSLYFVESAKKFLADLGITEIYTMSILSSGLVEKTMMKEYFFEIENPLNEFDRIMRSGLWSGLLLHASENAKKFEKFALFDLSNVYLPQDPIFPKIRSWGNSPANEEKHLGLLVYGSSASSDQAKKEEGLFVLKNYLDQFAQNFGLKFSYENDYTSNKSYTHPGRSAIVSFNGEKIGRVCEIHPMILENLGLKNRVWVAEINLEKLVDSAKNVDQKFSEVESNIIFKEFSRFEVSKRDIAVIVDENLVSQEISNTIKEIDDKIIGVELFDEFKSEKFSVGKKSLAFHLVFQAQDHTLNDEEADELFNKVLDSLGKKYDAEIRK